MDPGILTAIRAAHHAVAATLGTVRAQIWRGGSAGELDLVLTQAAGWLASAEDGISTRVNQTQFLAAPEAYDFGDGPVDPANGDQIVFELGTHEWRFEVRPPQSQEPCFVFNDPYSATLRIHGKLIARAPIGSSESSSESSVSP